MSEPVQPLRLYSYSRCSTCRQALAWLAAHDLDPAGQLQVLDITATPPSDQELRVALASLGRARLFNTSGQSYRALGSAVVKAMDDDQAIAALQADGRLIKRPFLVVSDAVVLTGFRPEEWQQALTDRLPAGENPGG